MNWDHILGKEQPKNTLLNNLLRVPKREDKKATTSFALVDKNRTHQADLLTMPDDGGFKSILTVVDVGTRLVDAEPLKEKTALTVRNAFEKIYKRNILNVPQRLEVDQGSEFKKEVASYFDQEQTHIRRGKAGRHKMQGIVERYNQLLGSYLFKRMTAEELLTGEETKEWVQFLPSLIKWMNDRAPTRVKKAKSKQIDEIVISKTKDENEILPIDTNVRVKLDHPINPVTGEKLHGRFRTTDIRYHPTIRTIKQIVMKPTQPILYLLNDPSKKDEFESVAYSRRELQVVDKNEKQYEGKEVVKGKPKTFIVDQILGKKKVKNKIYYKVKWVGYPDEKDFTWEPRSVLMQDVPDVIKEYEDN
ncbi:MAG: hypothetical protein RBS48_06145 [Ignavibacteriaceae bacterium]|jgi:hypothetical protein|nr:hypothetical protein [Ignavibacteriaceae bacterium]